MEGRGGYSVLENRSGSVYTYAVNDALAERYENRRRKYIGDGRMRAGRFDDHRPAAARFLP